MMSKVLRCAGSVVVVGFGGYAIWKGGRDLPALTLDQPSFWAWLGLGLGLYLVPQVLAAFAWAGNLAVFRVRLPRGRAETQFLVSQVGKYIPGNVTQFAWRLALARRDGIPGGLVGLAMLLEISVMLTAAGVLFLACLLLAPRLALSLLPPGIGNFLSNQSLPLAGALAAGIGLGIWYLIGLIRRKASTMQLKPVLATRPLALHVVSFLLLGLSLGCVIQATTPTGINPVLLSIPVFVVGWTFGFLTPGSQGGIGVREGVIVLGLGATLGEGPALTAALLHRTICVLGDLTAFAISSRYRPKTKGPTPEDPQPICHETMATARRT